MSRRKEILDAALAAFGETGEVAIEEVRRRSGASVGSIYHHFDGKGGIAAALYVEVMRGYQEGVLRTLGDAGEAERGVTSLVRYHLRWVARNPERARLLLRGGAARESAGEELGELNRALSDAVEAWIGAHDDVRPLSLEIFYAVVVGPAQELSRHWLAGRLPSLRGVEDDLAAAAWRAVRAG